MSLLKVHVNAVGQTFSYEYLNLNYRYFDIEFVFSDESPVLDVLFGYTVSTSDGVLVTRSFNEDFAYRYFETSAYFNTSRVDGFTTPELTVDVTCSYPEYSFNDSLNLVLPVPEKPFDSWLLGQNGWQPPVEVPDENFTYRWDDPSVSWIQVEFNEETNTWIDVG